uniref:Schwannomin interacting protein 1 C-terminal domain-containing protein n=1 Tax=Anopheles coluzzii TaxID=1518534 RepID=A0A6E8V4P1_ANOCL|nr:schwannomin-interacting protein 1-like [Anopheles coluzzii]
MCTRIRKGIINPNYPGFQSLAYTLNDDNFDYSSENPSDDEEDSYVSESDDNEMKQHERKPAAEPERHADEPGDENGNSYDQRGSGMGAGGHAMHLNSTMDVPNAPASTLYQHAMPLTMALEAKECFAESESPYRRTRMRLIPTGRHSPALTTAMTFGTEDKLEAAELIYACTPPDIVLQHSYEHRTSVFGPCKELAKMSLEHATSQKPDLIPQQQQPGDNEPGSEKESCTAQLTEALVQDVIEIEGNDENENEAELGQDDDDEREDEGNRSPPSPAIELHQAEDAFSITNCTIGSSFPQHQTSLLSPGEMLDETIQCYDGSITDDDALSDDSEQESEEGEFEYKPYGERDDGSPRSGYATSPSDVPASGDSGDSAGSSPGEVRYHLVDDCSNQTVQITRSRQSNEQSPTNHHHYHLLQQYATSSGTDYQGNPSVEQEINCNSYYDSSARYHAQNDPSEYGRQYVAANRNDAIAMEFSEPRPTTLNLIRRETNCLADEIHAATDTQLPSFADKRPLEKPQSMSTETVVPAHRQPYPKVAKINPFCEALFEENDACDFFTKQAKLQIEARMALCQAKDMAHMQMEIEKRSLPLSPVTRVIHTAVEKAGLSLAADKRRLSRYYLTRLNVHQLQTILTELQGHAEVLNEELVELLMVRDDLHISQDATLIDIEDLSRYLCAKEQTIIHAERQRKSRYWNNNRAAAHLQSHPKQQPSLPQPPIRSTCGTAIPAYRYH